MMENKKNCVSLCVVRYQKKNATIKTQSVAAKIKEILIEIGVRLDGQREKAIRMVVRLDGQRKIAFENIVRPDGQTKSVLRQTIRLDGR